MKSHSSSARITLPVVTAEGEFLASYLDQGLARLDFPSRKSVEARGEIPAQVRRWHQVTTVAVQAILSGRDAGKLPPLDLSVGTDFQQSVWRALQTIRSGRTLSYGQVAAAIGRPRAVRAVGAACGANPLPLIVPCHRVTAANQRIGGFSCGVEWKLRLLAREGVTVRDC